MKKELLKKVIEFVKENSYDHYKGDEQLYCGHCDRRFNQHDSDCEWKNLLDDCEKELHGSDNRDCEECVHELTLKFPGKDIHICMEKPKTLRWFIGFMRCSDKNKNQDCQYFEKKDDSEG